MTTRAHSTKIAAVVSDVDGTFLTDEKALRERARSAVAKLRASGIIFGVISVRPPRCLLGPLQITTPVIGSNGGVLTNPDLAIISERLLSPEVARRAVAVAFQPIIVESVGPALDVAAKIIGVSNDFALLARYERDVATLLAGQASVVRSQAYYLDITLPLPNKGVALSEPYYLDVTHLQANKGTVVVNLSKFLRIRPDQIATIGDMRNDVLMSKRAAFPSPWETRATR